MNLIVKSYGIGYAPRTGVNARSAELTVAIAVSFATAGERLTKKLAGEHYLPVAIPFLPKMAASSIVNARKDNNANIINIAGNGIYTLSHHKHTQEDINQIVYETLGIVHAVRPITKIVSGGQTGIDMAGAVAAVALDIDATITFPSGYLQRWQDGVDVKSTQEEMTELIHEYARQIHKIENWPAPLAKREFVF